MDEYIKNCGECPFFEQGMCNKFCEDDILEIKTPCNYAKQMTFSELEEEFNSDFKIGF